MRVERSDVRYKISSGYVKNDHCKIVKDSIATAIGPKDSLKSWNELWLLDK